MGDSGSDEGGQAPTAYVFLKVGSVAIILSGQ